jgi:hypothetical protein
MPPRTRLHVSALALALALTLLPGCGWALIMPADGTFSDGAAIGPFETGFAVYDAHRTVTAADGSVQVEKREEGRVLIFLSAAGFDPERDLAAMSAEEQENLRQDVKRSDLVFISALGASKAEAGSRLVATSPPPTGDFNFSLRRGSATNIRRNASYSDSRTLGSDQTLTLEMSVVNLVEGGRLEAQPLMIQAKKGEGQLERVATGEVRVRFNVPFVSERLGESNLAVLAPALL